VKARARLGRLRRGALLAAATLVFLVALAGPALAVSPSPQPVVVGDTRSSGSPPSFIGQPILAAIGVIALGVVAAGATILYVRLTQER
jgi:hypothetical protein